jgi:MoaA/NifB/PqqE/SkfB family radical SAM enzyme
MKFIDPRAKVFGHLDRLAAWKVGQQQAPVTVEWDLSNRCPLNCEGCHFAHLRTRGPWTGRQPSHCLPCGDLADTEIVQTGLHDMAVAGVQGIVWSGGGEPTTHPQWRDILASAEREGLQQGMYTSATLFADDDFEMVASTLAWIVVSLDTADGDTYHRDKGMAPGTFEVVCGPIRRLAECKQAVVGVSFLLHRENWQEADRMLALGRDLGATYTTFRPAILTDPDDPTVCLDDRAWISEAMPMLTRLSLKADVALDPPRFEQYRQWHGRGYATCYGIRLSTVVTPDSRVWICCQRRGEPDSCLGDLRVESFGQVWRRHPGSWTDFAGCRVMCRLHLINETLASVYAERPHEAFL